MARGDVTQRGVHGAAFRLAKHELRILGCPPQHECAASLDCRVAQQRIRQGGCALLLCTTLWSCGALPRAGKRVRLDEGDFISMENVRPT